MRTIFLFFTCLFISTFKLLNAQSSQDSLQMGNYKMDIKIPHFVKLEIMTDSLVFSTEEDVVIHNKEKKLAWEYQSNEQVIRGHLFVGSQFSGRLHLDENADFDILDSLELINDEFYRFRVRHKEMSSLKFPHFTFRYKEEGKDLFRKYEIKLFPYTVTRANFYIEDDLYVGEQKKIEIISNNVKNLVLDGEWKSNDNFNYRLREESGEAFIYLEPKKVGNFDFSWEPKTKQPVLAENGTSTYRLDPIIQNVNVKDSRLKFLRTDRRYIVYERNKRDGIEIQIENNRFLELEKTYRIEDREEKGGALLAELFTQRRLSNDKVLCILRPYSTHRTREGYMYIKDGDRPVFITNFNIVPKAKIESLMIMREGSEWTQNTDVKPGEVIDVRLEGESLTKGRYIFEDLEDISADTLTRSDRVANFRLRVPTNISKRTIEIYDRAEKTGMSLQVKEHQRPRVLDFIYVNYGKGPKMANTLDQPILYSNTIRDVTFSFDRHKIDRGDRLFGRQFVKIKVRIEDKNRRLIEMRDLGVIEICPAESSPRHAFYRESGCQMDDLRLNSFLSRKTHSLEEWARIEIEIEHDKDRHGNEGYKQRIVIHNQRTTTFDVEVTFPAGLLIQRLGEGSIDPLGGISLAMLGQFTFYHPNEIQRERPFKIGGGFLAQNAFNFGTDEAINRDLGLIILGSVYPVRTGRKLSFPLYAGAGYFLQAGQFFFVVGPGIRVQF
ncbi:MAG: hypothetical protein LAT68_00345 [Cyclobacteriaceae bacterium]|nr:hypothetical protein [Cyclobacteriaceae bacterium]MCH8514751.1 hypothetical protein [Cyclobacteriaceae bacterium]